MNMADAVPLPPMISYAQNGEDVVLRRALWDITAGFYVDIGSSYPDTDSVTRHFYENGWTGVNVDPLPAYLPLMVKKRPKDINLCIAISDTPGYLTFYEDPVHPGNSTCDPDVAEAHRRNGISLSERRVSTITLEQLLASYSGNRTIDFLKIDVEGIEDQVIRGNDWTKYRPRILIVEKHIEGIRMGKEESKWGTTLSAVGYEKVLYDGLNEFWLRQEDAFRKEWLAIPANILDNYVLSRQSSFVVQLSAEISALEFQRDEILRQRDEILNSRSWRLSKSFRFLARLLRGLTGHCQGK